MSLGHVQGTCETSPGRVEPGRVCAEGPLSGLSPTVGNMRCGWGTRGRQANVGRKRVGLASRTLPSSQVLLTQKERAHQGGSISPKAMPPANTPWSPASSSSSLLLQAASQGFSSEDRVGDRDSFLGALSQLRDHGG